MAALNTGLNTGPSRATYYDSGIAKFDKSGMVLGEGLFNGLAFEKSALDAYRSTQMQRQQKSDPAARMFGADPFANGGNIQGFKFDSSGKLYGVVGERTVERTVRAGRNGDGTRIESSQVPELIEMTGVQWDTSTVPQGTPGKFYDASIQQDNDGNILEIKDGANVVGYARAMIQRQLEPDARLGGGRSRTASPGADARVATTLLGGPPGDARKVTTKE